MVTATYIFNEEKVIAAGKTVEEMMAPIRQMLLENGAEEIAPGVFCKDGFYAMDVIDLPLIYKETFEIFRCPGYMDYGYRW